MLIVIVKLNFFFAEWSSQDSSQDGEGVDADYCVIGAGRQEPGCVQQPQERQE